MDPSPTFDPRMAFDIPCEDAHEED